MKKTFFVLFLLGIIFFPSKAESQDPIHYSLNTTLTSSSPDFFTLLIHQQIDFDCQIDSICPIDQTPEAITLTFRRIRGSMTHNDQQHSFDTHKEELYSLEFQCLKKLLNEPITILLNKEMKIKEEVQSFQHLLSLSTLDHYFISQDLLDQIVQALFIPVQAKSNEKFLNLSLYFPFKKEMTPTIDLKEGKEFATLSMADNLNLEGLYSTHQEPFSLHLGGKLSGKAQWKNKHFFVSDFSFSHKLKESQGETLFENPLTFEYSLSLKLTD